MNQFNIVPLSFNILMPPSLPLVETPQKLTLFDIMRIILFRLLSSSSSNLTFEMNFQEAKKSTES